jgi:YggT family protein
LLRQKRSSPGAADVTAMAIPGYGIAEQVFVGGFGNFLSIYNLLITGRILLSWFPQAQGVGLLQPLYQITDPFLNLFRGVIPPIFGLDLSPILAFFLLSTVTNATAAIGADLPTDQLQALRARASANNFGGSSSSSRRRNNSPFTGQIKRLNGSRHELSRDL